MHFLVNARECEDLSPRCQPNGSRAARCALASVLFATLPAALGCDSCTPAPLRPAVSAPPANELAPAEKAGPDLEAYRTEVLRQVEERRTASGLRECETAFDDSRNLARTLGADESALSAKDDFVRDCETLPLAVQRCMVLSYSMSHAAECRAVREGLTPAVRERVRRLSGAAVPDAPGPVVPEAPPP
jgi:hypothetical protein